MARLLSLPALSSLLSVTLAAPSSDLWSLTSRAVGVPDVAASCSTTGPQSCHNTTAQNTCCFNAPGGLLLQTQFWDASPATGPSDSWTVHGLWPDNCDGTYQSNCDASRAYTNISAIISASDSSLLSYMNTYWKNSPTSGTDESFWEHEWAKHGTCISTFNTNCYTSYKKQEEVVDFFEKTVALFKTLPSYTWLANAGITPSTSATYTAAAIKAALKAPRGVNAYISCANTNQLDEIWYYFNVKGSAQTGDYIPVDSIDTDGCPSTGIKYLPKGTSASPTTTGGGSGPTGTPGTPFSGKGYLQVYQGGSNKGCIISAGTWYIGGTCATFTATTSGSSFSLTSSKGACTITSGQLSCASGNSATQFTSSSGNLAYSGSSAFYAAAIPSGSTQQTVYTTSKADQITITWQSA